jgi:hypothetical protein
MALMLAALIAFTVIIWQLKLVQNSLDRIEQRLKPVAQPIVELQIQQNGQWVRWKMAVFKAGEEKRARLTITDKFGNAAAVDGIPSWGSLDPAICEVTADADGMGANVKSLGLMGLTKVQASGDAELGEGITPFLAEGDVEVIAGQAEVFAISFE